MSPLFLPFALGYVVVMTGFIRLMLRHRAADRRAMVVTYLLSVLAVAAILGWWRFHLLGIIPAVPTAAIGLVPWVVDALVRRMGGPYPDGGLLAVITALAARLDTYRATDGSGSLTENERRYWQGEIARWRSPGTTALVDLELEALSRWPDGPSVRDEGLVRLLDEMRPMAIQLRKAVLSRGGNVMDIAHVLGYSPRSGDLEEAFGDPSRTAM